MSLTEKQKRFIISPHSFSSIQQRMWRHIIKKKITQITKDFEFITQNSDNISQILDEGIQAHENAEDNAGTGTKDSSETQDSDFL